MALKPTRQALRLADSLTQEDVVIFLVSGGGSALFEMPLEGVSLEDIAGITRQLLACGADIVEINTLRKHLSAVKGGRFAERCAPAQVLAIVLSDVLGDPLDSIASGPACRTAAPAQDVKAIIARHHLRHSRSCSAGAFDGDPQAHPQCGAHCHRKRAGPVQRGHAGGRALGYAPLLLTTTLSCEAREAGACWPPWPGKSARRAIPCPRRAP